MNGMTESVDRLADVVYSAGMDEESEELKEIFNKMTSEIRRLREENERLDEYVKDLKEDAEFEQNITEQAMKQMSAENERLRKQHDTDDIAELESAHRMMAARNERLQKENDELAEVLRKADEYISKVVVSCKSSEYLDYDRIITEGETASEKVYEVLRKYGLGNDQQVQLAVNDLCKKYGLEEAE